MQPNQIDSLKSTLKLDLLGEEEDLSPNFVECLDYEDTVTGTKRIFKCLQPDCGKTFKFRSEMKRHLITHSQKKSYTCNYPGCNKSFKRSDALGIHERSHTDSTPFICNVPGCDSRFTSKSSFMNHAQKHGEKVFVCSIPGCNRKFAAQSQVKQHEKASLYHQRNVKKASSLDGNQENAKDQVESLNQSSPSVNETSPALFANIDPSPQTEENTIQAFKGKSIIGQTKNLESTMIEEDCLLLDMVAQASEENKILQKQLQETETFMKSLNYQNPKAREFIKTVLKLKLENAKEIVYDYLFRSKETVILRQETS